MKRTTRKELKSDKFAQEVGHTWEILSTHPTEVKRYGAIAVAVLVLAGGAMFYMRYTENSRKAALEEALRVDDATVGPQQPQQQQVIGQKNFATAAEKEKALDAAYGLVRAKYKGTQEGAIAQLYLGASAADHGDLKTAEQIYKEAVATAPEAYASVAKMSLAQIEASNGNAAEAEKLLRELVAKPSAFVSKEEATVVLAQLLLHSNPQEARKLLEPLRNSRTAISSKAIATLGLIPQAPGQPNQNN